MRARKHLPAFNDNNDSTATVKQPYEILSQESSEKKNKVCKAGDVCCE